MTRVCFTAYVVFYVLDYGARSLMQSSCQLKPEDLEDLTAVSRWLDLKTVAVRALRVHGGLRRHNEMYVALHTEAEPR